MANSIHRESIVYANTVCFFQVMAEGLANAGLEVEVEHDFPVPAGDPKRPDFAIKAKGGISEILEHKGSLPAAKHAVQELKKCEEKYRTFHIDGREFKPRVVVLYPVEKRKLVNEVRSQLPASLVTCSFDQTSKDDVISFEPDSDLSNPTLRKILNAEGIRYNPTIVRSMFKFIRAEPPITYTAFHLWFMFFAFRGIESSGGTDFLVDGEAVLDRINSFLPSWIRNNKQLTSGRVQAALRFLDRIGFIEIEAGGKKVRVHADKGSKSGDLLKHFGDQWSKTTEATEPRGKFKQQKLY